MLHHCHAWASHEERQGRCEAAEFSAWFGEDRGRRIGNAFARAAIGLATAIVLAFAAAHVPWRNETVMLCGCNHTNAKPAAGA